MEGKLLIQGKGKKKWVVDKSTREEAGPPTPRPRPCWCSNGKDPNCCYKAAEFACSACLFCVSCPICIAWCCIKMPCKIGLIAAGRAKRWLCSGSEKKIYGAYSSFSDIDSDSPSREVVEYHKSNTSGWFKNRKICRRFAPINKS